MIGQKAREISISLLPIALFAFFAQLLFQVGDWKDLGIFYGGMAFVFIGLLFFLIGVDNGLSKAGEAFGVSLAKSKKIWIVLILGLLLGSLITIAEPAVYILATQVSQITGGQVSQIVFLIFVSLGVGLFVSIGFLRVILEIPLWILLVTSYLIIFFMVFFVDPAFVAMAFDASGSTTGILSVPFILSLASGITPRKKDSKGAEKDSFGLIALASAGAIIGVLFFAITNPMQLMEIVNTPSDVTLGFGGLFVSIGTHIWDSLIAIIPIFILFLLLQLFVLKYKKRPLRKILFGFLYAVIGLTLFMNGVTQGFMAFGKELGIALNNHHVIFLYVSSFLLGFFSIIAEPAVYVLTHKIESVTSGYINKNLVLYALSIGVGMALLLNAIRILYPGNIYLFILVIGYALAFVLMFFTPKLFIGIAFDAGGVASGPISATFIFAFSQGIALGYFGQTRLYDLFGMISLIAMMPILTLEVLGILYRLKTRKDEAK